MFGIARIAIASVAIATAGTGSAVLVAGSPPPVGVDAAADLTAKAQADLSAAQQAADAALEALSSTDAEVKAEAEGLVEASATKLEQASLDMKAAVEAGSKTAAQGIVSFTTQTTDLVNSLVGTTAGTANASIEAGTHLLNAVEAQLAAARTLATAEGSAAVKSLTETKVALPQLSVPQASANVGVSGDASTTASAPAVDLLGSATGQLGINVGR